MPPGLPSGCNKCCLDVPDHPSGRFRRPADPLIRCASVRAALQPTYAFSPPSCGSPEYTQPNASASCPPGNANAYYPTVGMRPSPTPAQQHTTSSYSNGPSTSSTSNEDAAQQNFPMLRVQVAEQYRTMPPVSMVWHLLSIPPQDHDFLCKCPFSPCTYAALPQL